MDHVMHALADSAYPSEDILEKVQGKHESHCWGLG